MAYLKFFPLSVLMFCVFGVTESVAQVGVPQTWDQDIYAIRRTAMPDFYCPADDYIQYSPAALMLGLKACGYEGMSDWGPMLVADAFSVATTTLVVNVIKHTLNRTRPNTYGASFPSGHTATAFMTATMLHKEYGWRSPWWSIGGYTVAALTGVSRILNNKHWMTDIMAGAVVGVGSVHLGYYLSDLIFKNRRRADYEAPVFSYDRTQKHYAVDLYFGRRFMFAGSDLARGGTIGLSTDIPLVPETGVTVRTSASSMTQTSGTTTNLYSFQAGGFYNFHFAPRFELQCHALAGCGCYAGHVGADVTAGMSLGFLLDNNFKIELFADYETISLSASQPWLHSALLGWGSAWFF